MPETLSEGGGLKKKILVVDDDETTCTLIRSVLTRKGYEVTVAYDGEKGYDIAVMDRPDLIFLDCMLPGILGVDLGKKLKENETTRGIPIFFLTSLNTPKNVIDCYDAGADHYLVKPISPNELINHVRMSLENPELS